MEKFITTQDGERIKVIYKVLVTEKDGVNSYGIATYSYNNEGVLNESVEINDITQNVLEIDTLLMVLYKYEVTPVTLYDVLDVYLAGDSFPEPK